MRLKHGEIYSCSQLMEYIQQVGFLPLLYSGLTGFSAEEAVDADCRYVELDDGGWEWQLWKWKGPIVTEGNCAYGKFFNKKAGFIGMQWWPDFYNYRRSTFAAPEEGTIEDIILRTLREHGSLITRDLRNACGFSGPKMRSRFDAYITRLQMACYIVTEDFVYPRDRHNREYGWGWALLNTPERLFGHEACRCSRTPQESRQLIFDHLSGMLKNATVSQINKIIG